MFFKLIQLLHKFIAYATFAAKIIIKVLLVVFAEETVRYPT